MLSVMAEDQWGDPSGIRQYFFFVKENVSVYWKDLAFHLGFKQADIDNIEGRNRDDKSRCMDLLEEWLRVKGEKATMEALMDALTDSELQSTVDGLKRQIHHEDMGLQKEDVFQRSVKEYYEFKLTSFKPLIWNDYFTLTLSDIFTELELLHKGNGSAAMKGIQRKKLTSLDDLFNPVITGRSVAPRCILIEGEAGGGKTTFINKQCLEAVSQRTELGKRHDIIVLIRLREVREGETIEEIVWDQCVPETKEGVDVQYIRRILQKNESRVLFLLDGYDELRPEARAHRQAIPKLLSGKIYLKSTVVITSRPAAGVQQHTQPDCHVHIMGFSPEHVKKYVQRYFCITGNLEQGEGLVAMLNKSQVVPDLIHTPIFLALVCLLWEEDPEMVSQGTVTGLYNNFMTCLFKKYCKREGVDIPTGGLPKGLADLLLQLGKLALKALLRNETLLDLAEVEREDVNWEQLVKLGVVSLEVSASKLHPRKQLNFSHKTMQEFLAGQYTAHALLSQDIKELLQLTSISKVLEHGNLLQFTCGCDSGAAQAVWTDLCNLSSKDFSQLHADDFSKETHIPVKAEVEKLVENYKRFVLLCLDILNERKEAEVLQFFSRALPVIILRSFSNMKESVALKYYLTNIHLSQPPKRMILGMCYVEITDILQTLTFPVQGLPLDLELCHLTFESPFQTTYLVSILKNVPGLRALDLSHTQLTPSSLQPLVQQFIHMSLLEELDLGYNPELGDAGMEVLQVGLSSVPHLAVLRLGTSKRLMAEGLSHHKGRLRVGITAVGMSSLAPNMRNLVGLRELNISGNNVGDNGLKSLTSILHIFTQMQVIILRKTGISAKGMHTLAPKLYKLTRLIKVDISYNYNIGDNGVECLAKILPNLTAIKVLELCYTGISDSGILALVKALPYLVELEILSVCHNSIKESAIVSLVQTLCQCGKSTTTSPHYNTILKQLYFGQNSGVTGAVLERVAQSMSALSSLTSLDMSGDKYSPTHLYDTAAKTVAQTVLRLPALERLELRNVSMDPAGFQAMVQAAEGCPTLKMLIYDENLVPEGADITSRCLSLNRI